MFKRLAQLLLFVPMVIVMTATFAVRRIQLKSARN